MKKIIIFLSLCSICISGIASASVLWQKSVNNTINELMHRHQIPGAAVAIVDHGKSYIYVFGVANKHSNVPVTNKTIFEVGSITKLFTALTFVVIVNNSLALYDSLTKYLIADYKKNPYLRQITIEKLLTYTSGLPFTLPENIKTIDQLQNYLARWQSTNVIGTEWQYSNVGIGLVGKALENMHGEINQLYKKYILKPLGMTPIGIEVNEKFKPYYAQGYTEHGEMAMHLPLGLFPAAGDLKANIQDMSRFLEFAVGRSNASPKLKQAMKNTQTPRLKIGNAEQGLVWQIHSLKNSALLNEPEKMNLGPIPVKWLPKKQQLFDANKLIDKTGATDGFRAYVAVIPSRQLGIVILLNKYISNGAIVNAGRKILLKKP